MSKVEKNQKPTPTRYFAEFGDRTPPNCVPRLCSLTITRLSLLTTLPADLTSLSLAVKMQSSKRTLRSHEIPLPQLTPSSFGGIQLNSPPLLETELDLHFSLQYPHFLKRDGNRLLILLQRRKRYKTRTILGYKTLAEGVIKMDAVLQKSTDLTVELNDTSKSGRPGFQIASIRATQVSSSPVDQDNKNNNSVLISDRGNEFSDDDEEQDFSSNEDNDDGLSGYASKRNYSSKRDNYRKLGRNENDVEIEENLGGAQGDSDSDYEVKDKEGSRVNKISRQRNFKQKIVALLKRFRPEELENEVARRGQGVLPVERDLDALFHELESLSCGEESGQDIDSISIGSTPKPSIRPFFNSKYDNSNDKIAVEKRDSIISDKKVSPSGQERATDSWRADSSGNEGIADADTQTSETNLIASPPRDNPPTTSDKKKSAIFKASSSVPSSGSKKKQSLSFTNDTKFTYLDNACLSPTNLEPRKSLLEQLSRTFTTDDSSLPEILSIIGPSESGNCLINRLMTLLSANIRAIFQANNAAEIKAILQSLMNKIQKYCNSTAKPPSTIKVLLMGGDWLQGTALRHYVELLGSRPPDWLNHIRFFIVPIANSSVSRFLSSIDNSYASLFGNENWQQLCCNAETSQSKADTMEITNRIQRYIHSSGPCTQIPIGEALVAVVNYKDEDSCQIFVPFISDVRLGFLDGPQLSLDLDESATAVTSSQLSSSPPTGRMSPTQPTTPAQSSSSQESSLELQVDYWPLRPISDGKDKNQSKSQDQSKNSVKSSFKNFHVSRLPLHTQSSEPTNAMTLFFSAKEKKQKIMRLGKKKEKDRDGEKEQCIDGIARLICSAKQSHPAPLRVYIDGTEWTGVKFFQLSSQWQTHVKNFPVALIGAPSDIS